MALSYPQGVLDEGAVVAKWKSDEKMVDISVNIMTSAIDATVAPPMDQADAATILERLGEHCIEAAEKIRMENLD